MIEHVAQAKHNERFFAKVDLNEDSDWAVTALFYAALHYIGAYLAMVGCQDPGSHGGRLRLIRQDEQTRKLFKEYSRLKDYSENARYQGKRFSTTIVQGLDATELSAIRTEITRVLPPQRA